MNVKLIFGLSLFGLAMAFATVYFIPSTLEPFCWLPIFIVSAWQIAKHAERKFFLHGFLVSLLNYVWMTWIHISLSKAYMAHHIKEAAQYEKLYREINLPPAMAMIVMAPFIGMFYGLVLGFFSMMARGIYSDR